ncbi:MAG: glycosyltransferase family 4 protein [Armatimonadota bacterium]
MHKSIGIIAHSPRTVRIAIGDTGVEAGGAELQLAWTAQLLRERGWDVSLIMPRSGEEAPPGDGGGFSVIPAHAPRNGGSKLGYLTSTVRDYWRALATADSEVYLHRGATGLAGWTGLYCSRNRRQTVLSAASNLDVAPELASGEAQQSRLNRALYQYYLRRCGLVLVQSPAQAQLYQERYGRQAEEMPNIADVPDALTPKSSEPLVAWAGAIRKCKRPLWVVDIARELPEVRFVIAGGPNPGEDELWEQLQQAAATVPNVELAGWLSVSGVQELLGQAWVSLCTSQMEGFPNVYLMAWGQETPLVTSFGAGGLVERSGAGVVGETTAELAQALRVLFADAALRQQMGRTGRQYTVENHGRQTVGDRYDRLLTGLLS